jgi:hypothetical protein
MHDKTVQQILAMIDDRRRQLDEQWEALQRDTRESYENLAKTDVLTDLKWAIMDTQHAELTATIQRPVNTPEP